MGKISKKKIFIKFPLIGISALLLLLIIGNAVIDTYSGNYSYNDIENVPANKTGLVPGTSKYLATGDDNPYFRNRIRSAVELYESGKIEFIIVSGDNSEIYYNEPRDMKKELMSLGIPESHIFQDYAGFSTLDAVVRAKEIFGQQSFTVISQEFHNNRAIFLGRMKGLEVSGYNAEDLDVFLGFKTRLRELFARVKVYVDLIFNKQPKFLGEKIKIEERSLQQQLDERKIQWKSSAPEDVREDYQKGIDTLSRSGILDSALNVNDTAPDFTLKNVMKENVNLSKILKKGTVVLFWYRGGWCPYCNLQLRAYNDKLEEFKKYGAQLVAVTPESPDNSLTTKEKNKLEFTLLSDPGNMVAEKFNLKYKLPEMVKKHWIGKLDLPDYNKDNSWTLPLAVTYIIDRQGIIRYAFIDADYRRRAEPKEIIEVLKTLASS